MYFDSHCHLTADVFAGDLDEVLDRARAAGVERAVAIASTPDDTRRALEHVADGVRFWTTAGVHPHEAEGATTEDLEAVRALTADSRVVAVGECGLDFHYDFSDRRSQLRVFEAQIDVASATGLPLVVHARSADADMTRLIREVPPGVVGVLHCFTGGEELLEAALARDWYVSFTGIVTFKRFSGGDRVRAVPEDRIMIETDAPYLAPVPHRGKRNEPAFVVEVAAALARLRGDTLEAVRDYTRRNAIRFYGVEETA